MYKYIIATSHTKVSSADRYNRIAPQSCSQTVDTCGLRTYKQIYNGSQNTNKTVYLRVRVLASANLKLKHVFLLLMNISTMFTLLLQS